MIKLIWNVDNWHSKDSRILLGAFSKKDPIVAIKNFINRNNLSPLSQNDINCLNSKRQTQGYVGAGEFAIEEVTIDELI